MYNYQTFLRKQQIDQHCSAIRNQHIQAELKRQHSMPQLAHAHKKRVEGFIMATMDKPIAVSQYKNQPPCFRHTSPQAILGHKSFYIQREHEAQRIEAAVKRNAELDQVPFSNSFNHQFRDTTGKGLRYKPLNHSLRVREFLDRQDLNYLPNSTHKPDKILKKALKGEKVDSSVLTKTVNKSLLPTLHSKTYFKSVSTLFTEIPTPHNRSQHTSPTNEGSDDTETDPYHRAPKPKDHLIRKQNSRDVLIKCNMLPMRG